MYIIPHYSAVIYNNNEKSTNKYYIIDVLIYYMIGGIAYNKYKGNYWENIRRCNNKNLIQVYVIFFIFRGIFNYLSSV